MINIIAPVLAGIVKSMVTQAVVEEICWILLRYLVSKTDNELDDKILKAFEAGRKK